MASADEKAYNKLVARRAKLKAKENLSKREKAELETIEASLLGATSLKSFLKELGHIRQAQADARAGKGPALDDLEASIMRRDRKK